MGNEFGAMPVAQLVAGFRSGAFPPVEVATTMLDRIERFNPDLNAFTYVDAEGALASARQSEERWQRGQPLGALDGVPVTVKELLAAAAALLARNASDTGHYRCFRLSIMIIYICDDEATAIARAFRGLGVNRPISLPGRPDVRLHA